MTMVVNRREFLTFGGAAVVTVPFGTWAGGRSAKAVVFNVEKFATHDGPGIRTVVFLKGCPLRCRWCHSPESWTYRIESYPNGETVGWEISADELLVEVLKDRDFFVASKGGVTLSGGEPLAQPDFCVEFLRKAKAERLHTAIETSGFAADSPSWYLRKIGAMVMSDHAVFALFNDDRHIRQFLDMGYPLERARDYVGCGCWDGAVDSWSDLDDANYVSVVRLLELAIFRDPAVEERCRVRIDPVDKAKSFEEFRDILYRNFIRFRRDVMSGYTRYGGANARVFPHPTYSMCLEGGVKTRRDTTEGGVRFRPRIVTLAFMANVVDSLCAIRKVCFEDRAFTLAEMLEAVRSNWAGKKGAAVRAAALQAPYWGDDTEASNGLMSWWINRVSDDIAGLRNDRGGEYVLACWIYREFHYWGLKTKATPDGRRDGDRLAQGFSPSECRCQAGVTTVLNAIGSIDHARLYASNANLSFEKSSMAPETFEAVFRVACKKGMHLLQPNCTSAEELRDAQIHPERHRNIIVKVCGFSARFVSLSKRWQDEVIERHRLR